MITMNKKVFSYCVFIGYILNTVEPKLNAPRIFFATKNGSKQVDGKSITVYPKINLTLICNGDKPINWTYTYNNLTQISEIQQTFDSTYVRNITFQNISYASVGFYYCQENKNFDSVSKVYLFIQDDEHLSVHPEKTMNISGYYYSIVTLPCRPTMPDISVTIKNNSGKEIIIDEYNEYEGFKIQMTIYNAEFMCIFFKKFKIEVITIFLKLIPNLTYVAKPTLEAPNYGKEKIGKNYTMNCSLTVYPNINFTLIWTVPDPNVLSTERIIATKASLITTKDKYIGFSLLTISKLLPQDQGIYNCKVIDQNNNTRNVSQYIKVFDETINLEVFHGKTTIITSIGHNILWLIYIDSYLKPNLTWINTVGEKIRRNDSRFDILSEDYDHEMNYYAKLKIFDVVFNDSGVYQLIANNGKDKKTLNLTLIVQGEPIIQIFSKEYQKLGEIANLTCVATSNPISYIKWFFKPCLDYSCNYTIIPAKAFKTVNQFQVLSILEINATKTGLIRCFAHNNVGENNIIKGFYLSDVEKSQKIWINGNNSQVAPNSTIQLHCAVSIYNYTSNINWYHDSKLLVSNTKHAIEKYKSAYTYKSTLIIKSFDENDNGIYRCQAKTLHTDIKKNEIISINVRVKPVFTKTNLKVPRVIKEIGNAITWTCEADGVPTPRIIWTKDNRDLSKSKHSNHVKLLANNTILNISYIHENDTGIYTCKAYNSEGMEEKSVKLEIFRESFDSTYIIIIVILAICFLGLFIILCIRFKIERKFRNDVKEAGLLYFEKGAIENLNPKLQVNEQSEFLPYDKKWEFSSKNLRIGEQLGSGAFGIVMKAEAHGLVKGNLIATVAVKMIKSNSDPTCIKALASELKVMVHLGKHLNIVNLLGACTENILKKYCRFGNLHNYLLRHRDDFVNQIDPETGKIDVTIKDEFLNLSTAIGNNKIEINNQQTTTTNNRMKITDAISCTSNEQYNTTLKTKTDQIKGQPSLEEYQIKVKSTSTRDLLCWSFQVARGMEYLASRNVLHGDLAARNILLADDNVVKICDFGLAKNLYKSGNYQKKGHGPLPVKWMAVESIGDKIFSTQSDVWSFGIVLWEFFSLAKTPYPGMEAGEFLYKKLVDGYRMEQPEYAPKDIYQVMLQCWHEKPIFRPSFTKLADDLGNMLHDTVREHYIELNDPYVMMNNEKLKEQTDYLITLSSPDYQNITSHESDKYNKISDNQPGPSSNYLKMDILNFADNTLNDNKNKIKTESISE